MNSLFFLGILSYLFWKLHERFEFAVTTQMYYGAFVICYVTFYFLHTFFPEFIYKVFKEIYDIQKKPLYDVQAFNRFSEFKELNQTNRYSQKQILHSKQGGRCANCVNFILSNEAESAYINYKQPLEQGGTNGQDNLKLICQGCQSRIL